LDICKAAKLHGLKTVMVTNGNYREASTTIYDD